MSTRYYRVVYRVEICHIVQYVHTRMLTLFFGDEFKFLLERGSGSGLCPEFRGLRMGADFFCFELFGSVCGGVGADGS